MAMVEKGTGFKKSHWITDFHHTLNKSSDYFKSPITVNIINKSIWFLTISIHIMRNNVQLVVNLKRKKKWKRTASFHIISKNLHVIVIVWLKCQILRLNSTNSLLFKCCFFYLWNELGVRMINDKYIILVSIQINNCKT